MILIFLIWSKSLVKIRNKMSSSEVSILEILVLTEKSLSVVCCTYLLKEQESS